MKSYKDINTKETDLEEKACWVGYKKVGMKKKGNRMVPDCVKEEVVNEVYGKDWTYEESTNENVGDMYKGKLSTTQLTNLKNLWKNKRQSDVTPSVKSYVKGLDQFTKMDIKQANIKYLSNLIDSVQKEEVDFITPLKEQIEIVEMNSVVRKTELKEFNSDQIERLAKAYSMMKDRTISVDNAKRLAKMMDGVPANSLNALRKKRIPFLSGLALNRMIKLKMPVTEDLDKDDEKSVDGVVKQLKKAVKAHQGQVKSLTKDLKDDKDLEEVRVYRVSHPSKKPYEIEADDEKEAIKRYKDEVGLKSDSGIKTLFVKDHGEDLEEADLSKSQITKVHKQADDLPKKDFMKRYGKDGNAVRYATATNMVKKKLGIGEDNKLIKKGELKVNESYKLKLNSAMEHYNIASLAELKDEDHKAFFKYVDGLSEGLSAGQKKLPPALQKSILAKQGDKKEELSDKQKKMDMNKNGKIDGEDLAKLRTKKEQADSPAQQAAIAISKKEKEMKELKAETDPTKVETMKKEMMNAMKKMPEMADMSSEMKKEMMEIMKKKMNEYGSMNITAMKKEDVLDEKLSAQDMKLLKVGNYVRIKGRPEQYVIHSIGQKDNIEVSDKNGDVLPNRRNTAPIKISDIDDIKDFMKDQKDVSEMSEMKPMNATKMNAMTDPKKMNAMHSQDPRQDMIKKNSEDDIRAMKTMEMDMAKNNDDTETPSMETMKAAMMKKDETMKKETAKKRMNAMKDANPMYAMKTAGMEMMRAMREVQKGKQNIKGMYGEKYLPTKEGSLEAAILKSVSTKKTD